MNEIVQIEIPEAMARQMRQLADYAGVSLENLILDWLRHDAIEPPLESLDNDQILNLSDIRLPTAQQDELSTLLFDNQEGHLDNTKKARLDEILDLVQNGTLLKARALEIAVNRGLRPPLSAQNHGVDDKSLHSD